MSKESACDPRDVLTRQKYFSLRPRPLEQWLWKQGVPASAERVFWLHWQEGMIRRDWCSEIGLRRVATHCDLDVSSVTRAYQLLTKLGLIRRQDPGRDPARPFERAVTITEVRMPLELVQGLNRYPDRARPEQVPASSNAVATTAMEDTEPLKSVGPAASRDPFEGMCGRERMRALTHLVNLMSAAERRQYDDALRTCDSKLTFDADTKFTATQQEKVLQFLAIVGRKPMMPIASAAPSLATERSPKTRRLSVFELARIRRAIQQERVQRDSAEVLREVVWSVEEGALSRFASLHAVRIALKKIREDAWTRPNKMPPNWSRALGNADAHLRESAQVDACSTA
jgi:hypothetical protein